MQNPDSSLESLSQRVRRTLEDLASIRESLASTQVDRQSEGSKSLSDLELASELKNVVDVLRELLWTYITALSAKSGRRPQEVLEWYKMELAVGMLRQANARRTSSSEDEVDRSSSFEHLVTQALTVTAAHTSRDRHV